MRTCSCRKWDPTGMPCYPCKHVVTAIWNTAENGLSSGVPESWVDLVSWLYSWKKVYMHTINPIVGHEMWPPSRCPTKLTHPKYHKQAGVISYIGCEGEQRLPYKGLDTFTIMTHFKNREGRALRACWLPKRTISWCGYTGLLQLEGLRRNKRGLNWKLKPP
ncbi:putative Zinc finger, SWIM-type [Helianthus annuus]|nr:putative Zinc finger, SWIM-type [Helianthus annuus]